jgi:hypothetical protein
MLIGERVYNLGSEKRNSEFFVITKQFLDFAIDEEVSYETEETFRYPK